MRTAARTALVATVVGAAAFTGGAALADSFVKPSDPDNPLVQRGCVIRFDTKNAAGKTVPRIHANTKHYCVGVTGEPTVDDQGRLVVRTDGGDQPVVTLSVSPDETFTTKGISCGGSGGSGTTRITCADQTGTKVRADSPELYDTHANLWLSWTTWKS